MSGVSSQGLVISRGNGASPEVFAAIANITSHDGPSKENPEIDVTTLSSVAKEFLPGLTDNGELSVELNFDPEATSHDLLLDDMDTRTSHNYKITWPDPSPHIEWSFNAFVRSFSTASAVDAPLTGSLTLRINGAVTRP